MRFRNSLRLLMDNFKQVYRLLLAKLIIGLVATALCCAFVLPELIRIWNSAAVQGLVENFKEFFKTIFSANPTDMEGIKQAIFGKGGSISQVTALLSSMMTEIAWTIIGCMLVYLLKRFAETICHFTVGSMLNDKMASFSETKFSAAFVSNLGKASVYSLVYVPIVFLMDAATLGLVWLIMSFCPILIGLFISMTVIALVQTLKLTVTGTWLPGMIIDDKKISEAMRLEDETECKQKYKMFSGYLVSVYLIVIVNVMSALATFGSALLVTVPASYFFLICLQQVNYYTMKGKKYFLTFKNIATNPDHGDVEHYFNYISEEQKEDSNQEEK